MKVHSAPALARFTAPLTAAGRGAWATCVAAGCACAVAAITGCQSSQPQPAAPPPGVITRATPVAEAAPALGDESFGATPEDFEIDVTVLVGRGMPETMRVEERTSRYVLLPDGALHAETGEFLTQASRPGRARWLYQQQVSALWGMCNQASFTDLSLANGPANPDMLRVSHGERLTIIVFRANGRCWSFVNRASGGAPTDPAAARLVRTLAALAWVPDYTPRDFTPERYDYGPDPYAVYRAIRAEGQRP